MLKKIVNDGIYEEFWISNVYIFSEKCSMIFLNCLIKSLIHKIKEHEIFQKFLTSTVR